MWEAWRKQICLLTPPTNSLGHRDGAAGRGARPAGGRGGSGGGTAVHI